MRLFGKNISLDDAFSVVIVILLIAMTRTHQSMFYYVALGCCLLRIHKPLVILPGYFLSSLSTSYFAVIEGMGAARYMSLILIVSCLIHKFRNSCMQDRYFSIILLLLFCCFFSSLIGPTGSFDTFVKMTQNLLILLFVQRMTDINIERLFLHLIIAFGLCSISVFVEAMANQTFLFEQRYHGVADGEEGIKANRLAIMLEQCGAICIAGFMFYKNKIVKLILILCVVACVFVIIATGSRTGLIALFAAIFFSVFVTGGIRSSKILMPLVVILIAGYFVIDYLSSINSVVLDRFTLSSVGESGGTGRADYSYIIMTKFFPDHLFFGSGIGGENMKYYAAQYGFDNLCHNIIYDPLSQMGLIIYSLFLCFFVPAGRRIMALTKQYPEYSVFVVLLVAVCMNGIGETIFYEKYFWNDIALCLLCCNSLCVEYKS